MWFIFKQIMNSVFPNVIEGNGGDTTSTNTLPTNDSCLDYSLCELPENADLLNLYRSGWVLQYRLSLEKSNSTTCGDYIDKYYNKDIPGS